MAKKPDPEPTAHSILRDAIVERVKKHGSVAEAARSLDIHPRTVEKYLAEAVIGGA